jgi:fimbrial chaperone protein
MDRPHASRPTPGLFIQMLFRSILLFTLVIPLLPSAAYPGQWQVSPAMIFLGRESKSSVITVTNEGEDKVNLQVKAMEWSQDPEGKDIYRETNDLIFFPRILIINKNDHKIVRTGIRVPAVSKEKAYRLFIEEIPQPRKPGAEATQLTIAIRFGVPVFVKPMKEELKGELAATELAKGVFSASVKNTGNSHFRITEIMLKGKNEKEGETFNTKLNGWYLLPDASRVYSIPIPDGKCAVTDQLELSISTDTKIKLDRRLNVEKGHCSP